MQPSKGLNYILSDNGTSYIVSGVGTCTDASIVIPSIYNGKPMTGICGGAFEGCSNITNIVIPNSIKRISAKVFRKCRELRTIDIPSGVTSIGNSAFEKCTNLRTVTIPSSVVQISFNAFSKCKSLKNVYYEGSVKQWNQILIRKGNGALVNANVRCVGETSPIDTNVQDSQTLYIYKGNIRCKRHKHNIISATAKLKNISDQDIVINVEYCTECKKYILSYDLFLHYRDKHHVLIGDLKLVTNEFYDGNIELAEESPLHLCGYNVGQKDDYTSSHRHYILAKLIYDGIMEKQKILDYLSAFVRSRKGNSTMKLAVSKWEDDISFVQQYNISTQPSTIITKVTRY